MNNFSGIGRIGRDAEVRHTNSGQQVTSWPLAVDVGYGQNKSTLWIDCAMWGERGTKIADYIRKGDRIGVYGEISLDNYKGNDGAEKSRIRLRVADVTLLGSKQDGGHSDGQDRPQGRATTANQRDIPRDTDGFETRGGAGSNRAPSQNRQQRVAPAPVQEHRDDFEGDDIPFTSSRGIF